MSWRSGSCRARGGFALSLLAVLTVALLLGAPPAFAGTIGNWTAQPKGTVGTGVPVIVQGSGAPDAYPLVASSIKLYIDGALVPRASYTATISSARVYVYYNPSPVLKDGVRTFRVEVTDTATRLSYYQWTATIGQPPSAAWTFPAAGATVYSGSPKIVMSLSDNTPSTTFSVVGQVHVGSANGTVISTFGGTGLAAGSNTFTLPGELPFGAYTLTATVTDAAGNARTLAGTAGRSFTTVTLPAMTVLQSCDACHADMKTAHPTPASSDCGICHPDKVDDHMQGTEYCEDCHWDGWHTGGAGLTVAVSTPCFDCHNQNRTDIPRHTAASAAAAHESSCNGCHNTSLIVQHAVTPVGSVYTYQCDVCHASTRDDVEGAIDTGQTSCAGCHSVSHVGFEAKHTATASSCVATDCHASNSLVTQHEPYVGPDGDYPEYPDTCSLCHLNQDPDRVPSDATAECATCHPERVEPHGFDPVKHTATDADLTGTWPSPGDTAIYNPPYAYTADCSECHDLQMTDEHAKETASTASDGCQACHPSPRDSFGVWSKSCTQAGCHTLSGTAHEASGAAHGMASVDIDGGCGFVASNGRRPCHYRDLVQEHNRTINVSVNPVTGEYNLKALSVSCVACHNSAAFSALGGAWNGSCNECHDGTALQNHTVVGSARFAEVYAKHDNPSGYYDNGTGNAGANTMDAHGWIRPNPDQNSANKTIGCGVPTCHTQAYTGGGWPYPSNSCSDCHGPSIALPDPYQGDYSWYSESWYDSEALDTRLTMTLDPITLPAGSMLDFKSYYDIEEGWDYGYVQISTDGGSTWTNLPGDITTNASPYGMNAGNGITGASRGWVDSHFDLSAYAGQTVKIRFAYVGDFTIYGLGWMIDVITVGPAGAPVFYDDCETPRPEWGVETYLTYYDMDLEEYVTAPTADTGWRRFTRTP